LLSYELYILNSTEQLLKTAHVFYFKHIDIMSSDRIILVSSKNKEKRVVLDHVHIGGYEYIRMKNPDILFDYPELFDVACERSESEFGEKCNVKRVEENGAIEVEFSPRSIQDYKMLSPNFQDV